MSDEYVCEHGVYICNDFGDCGSCDSKAILDLRESLRLEREAHAKMQKDLDDWKYWKGKASQAAERLERERDAERAAHEATKRELLALQHSETLLDGEFAQMLAERDAARAELQAEHERREEAEEQLRIHLEWHKQVCPREIENAEKNDRISLEGWQECRSQLAKAEAERDEAKALLDEWDRKENEGVRQWATAVARIAELEGALKEVCDDLESEVRAKYEGMLNYPIMQRRMKLDLSVTADARAVLSRPVPGEPGQPNDRKVECPEPMCGGSDCYQTEFGWTQHSKKSGRTCSEER